MSEQTILSICKSAAYGETAENTAIQHGITADEVKAIWNDNPEKILELIQRFKDEGFPEGFGLCECPVIVIDLKSENAKNVHEATTKLIATTTGTLIDVVKGDKNFDEASRALTNKSTGVVKTIIIERAEKVAVAEAQRIGREFAGQATQTIIKKVNDIIVN